jgi:hypothetical protein
VKSHWQWSVCVPWLSWVLVGRTWYYYFCEDPNPDIANYVWSDIHSSTGRSGIWYRCARSVCVAPPAGGPNAGGPQQDNDTRDCIKVVVISSLYKCSNQLLLLCLPPTFRRLRRRPLRRDQSYFSPRVRDRAAAEGDIADCQRLHWKGCTLMVILFKC